MVTADRSATRYNLLMLELSRTVRFCLNGPATAPASKRHNGFAAYPAMRGLGRYYEMVVNCRGRIDPATGYLINIKQIDEAFATHVLPEFERLVDGHPTADLPMGDLLRRILERLQDGLHQTVTGIRLHLTPSYHLIIRSTEMDHLIIREQFEFAAAHRLHVPHYSDRQNQQVFGKCNNPAGHGHNYRLEVVVRAPIDADGHILEVEQLDELVNRTVIQKLDHKYLNIDVPQFADLNPSVEQIAKVIYEMLCPCIGQLGVELEEVCLWETAKTSCTYRPDQCKPAGTTGNRNRSATSR